MSRRLYVVEDYERAKSLLLQAVVLTFGAGVFSGFSSISAFGSYAYWLASACAIACVVWLWIVMRERDRLIEVLE